MAPPLATLAVCTHNRARLLGDCLDSLLGQDVDPTTYEVMVVADGCRDDTSTVVASRAGRARKGLVVRHVPQPHGGLNKARNTALREARAEVVCFLDDDELAPTDHLRKILARLTAEPELSGVGGPCKDWGGDTLPTCPRCSLGAVTMGDEAKRVSRLFGGNMALRRDPAIAVGPFDEGLSRNGGGRGDESEWFHRATEKGLRFGYFPELWIHHRRDGFTLSQVCRTAFMQGRFLPASRARMGHKYYPNPLRIGRYLGHAAVNRCAHGLVLAGRDAGAAWTVLRQLFGLPGPEDPRSGP